MPCAEHDQCEAAASSPIPIKAAVARQLRPLLDDALSVVFYDLTTIRIRGRGAVAEDVRAYGLSKDTGGIARQLRMREGRGRLRNASAAAAPIGPTPGPVHRPAAPPRIHAGQCAGARAATKPGLDAWPRRS